MGWGPVPTPESRSGFLKGPSRRRPKRVPHEVAYIRGFMGTGPCARFSRRPTRATNEPFLRKGFSRDRARHPSPEN